jgi:NAD(P)-dependent dehydrogenase (short-subunit alcohol dehydrogenase family)
LGLVDGKVALVTGAARGQGRAEAVRLAEEGADIIAVDICEPVETIPYEGATLEDLEETAALVRKHGRRIVTVKADVRGLAAMETAVSRGTAELGRLDIVVANAGVMGAMVKAWELTEEDWRTTIDVNLTGVWHTIKATVPYLIQ